MEGEGDCKKAQDFPSISHQMVPWFTSTVQDVVPY